MKRDVKGGDRKPARPRADRAARRPLHGDFARDLIECDGGGLRFRNHERNAKTGKLIRCE